MTDRISRERRSENMRRIRAKNMKPELVVRSVVHALGYRFRLHRRDLPGNPDLVLPRHQKIVLVHGCFWHGHGDPKCVDGRRQPKSNLEYWLPKLQRNKERDAANLTMLQTLGWQTCIIWECETKLPESLERKLKHFLEGSATVRQAA